MRKWLGGAGGLAVIVALVLLALQFLGGTQSATAAGPINWDIDPNIETNTGSSLSTIQPCWRVNGSGGFDQVADWTIDATVQNNVPAPKAYDAWVTYNNTYVNVLDSSNDLIKLPGATSLSTDEVPADARRSTDGIYNSGAIYLAGGPGTAGDGAISRIALDIDFTQPPAMITFGFNKAALKDAGGVLQPNGTVGTGKLAINTPCVSTVDIGVASTVTSAPADDGRGDPAKGDINVSSNYNVSVSTVATNYGPDVDLVNVKIQADIAAPAGCNIVGSAHSEKNTQLQFGGTASDTLNSTFTIHCSEPSDHTFTITNNAYITDSGFTDPEPQPNTDVETVPLESWVYADVDLLSFGVTNMAVLTGLTAGVGPCAPPCAMSVADSTSFQVGQMVAVGVNTPSLETSLVLAVPNATTIVVAGLANNHTGGQIVADPLAEEAYCTGGVCYLDVSNDIYVTVTKTLHLYNDPAHPTAFSEPLDVDLVKTVTNTPGTGTAVVAPMSASETVALYQSIDTDVDETFVVHCTAEGTVTVTIDNDVALSGEHVIEIDSEGTATATLNVECVPPFTPGFLMTIDDTTAGEQVTVPSTDICVLGAPCESKTDLSIPDNQPLASGMMTAIPGAFTMSAGETLTNAIKVGNVTFGVEIQAGPFVCPNGNYISGGAILSDAAMCPVGYTQTATGLIAPAGPGAGVVMSVANTAGFNVGDLVDVGLNGVGPGPPEGAGVIAIAPGAPGTITVNNLGFPHNPGSSVTKGYAINAAHCRDAALVDTPNNMNALTIPAGWSSWSSDLDWVVYSIDSLDGNPNNGYPTLWSRATGYISALGMPVNVLVFDARLLPAPPYGPGGWISVTVPGPADPFAPAGTVTCSPLNAFLQILGSSEDNPQTPGTEPVEKIQSCDAFGTHLAMGIFEREDTGQSRYRFDTVSCIETKTDVEVTLVKDEDIQVPEDVVHTETVDVNVYNNGAAPTDYTVSLTQVSTDKNKCVSHLVPAGRTNEVLHEFTVGNQFYSQLTWEEATLAAYGSRTTSVDYTIVCSVPGDWDYLEQFVVDVDPITMTETDPVDNTDENHVSVTSVHDWDNDTWPNDQDNCWEDPNPDQLDTDGDGLGDVCDPDDDDDGIDDVDDDCPLLPGDPGPPGVNGCPMSDISIDVDKDETPDVDISQDTAYPVTLTVTNGDDAAVIDITALLISEDPAAGTGCTISWGGDQPPFQLVEEVIAGKLHSELDASVAFAASEVKTYNLTATLHCFEKSLHVDAFELAVGAAPQPPVWDEVSANNIHKNWPDVTVWETADVKKVAFFVDVPPTNIDVSADVPVTVVAVLHNNGPYGPVDISDEMNAIAPADCSVAPDSHTEVVPGVPVSVDVVISGVFTIHCSEPSQHTFTFTDDVTVLTEHVKDPNGNNHAEASLTVDAIAYADVKIIDQSWLNPPAEIFASVDADVTLRKVLHNNGPYDAPVEVTVTKTAIAPQDCTIDPARDQFQVVLPPSVDVVIDETLTIHCSSPSFHTFTVENEVSGPKDAHVVDPDPSNNISAKDLTVGVLATADLKLISWSVPDDLAWKSGIQVLVGPLPPVDPLPQVESVIADEVIHNNGPVTPVNVEITKTATSLDPAVCSIAGSAILTASIAMGVPYEESETFLISWLDDPKPPFTCDVKIDKTVDITDLHVGDDSPISATLNIEAVRDTDVDGIPDDGDFTGDANDNPCDTGESQWCDDNCQDDYNPDQLDADDDGKGAVCDDYDHHDLITKSLIIFGPAPLNLSDTTGRYMWAIGEVGNLSDHTETALLSLTIDPNRLDGCLADPFAPALILPGHNPFTMVSHEQKWVLYRTRFECHDPAAAGIYPLTITLCIDHQAHVPPSGDDLNTANDCQTRIRSLLIEGP